MSQASKAFMANPLEFMRQNLVVIDGGGLWCNSKDDNFDLTPTGDGFSSKGSKIPQYSLARARSDTTDPIPAYWLAMQWEGVESKVLDTSRKVFFTDGLSGCAFVAGSGPKPLVKHIHADLAKPDEVIDDPHNAGMDIYTAANYKADETDARGNEGRASVFGIKTAKGWEFWAQARIYDGKKWKMRFPEGIMPV